MPPVKKQSRPRIDAIVRHIKSGSYDEEVSQLQDAINARNKDRQEAVLRTVREVFGKRANIVIETVDDESGEVVAAPAIASKAKPKATRRARPGGPPKTEDPDIKAAEDAALQRERELEAEMAAQSNGDVLDPNDPEAGVESNSPVIGSM